VDQNKLSRRIEMTFDWTHNTEMAEATKSLSYEQFLQKFPDAVGQISWDAFRKKKKRMLEHHDSDIANEIDLRQVPDHFRPIFLNEQGTKDLSLDDFLTLAPQLQEVLDNIDPVTVFEPIVIPSDKPIIVCMAGCMHIGGRYTFYEEFRVKWDRLLETPGLYVGDLGDSIEGYLPRFFSSEAVTDQLFPRKVQLKVLDESILRPLSELEKLLFGCNSQHAGKWEERSIGENSVKQLFLKYKVPFFDGRGQIDLTVGSQTYHLGLAHGLPGSSIWNPLHPHVRALRTQWPSADVIIQGDRHTYAQSKTLAYPEEFDAGRRSSPWVYFVQSGTAKSGLDKYTIQNWHRGVFEWPFIFFHHERHEIRVTNEWSEVEEWIQTYYG